VNVYSGRSRKGAKGAIGDDNPTLGDSVVNERSWEEDSNGRCI